MASHRTSAAVSSFLCTACRRQNQLLSSRRAFNTVAVLQAEKDPFERLVTQSQLDGKGSSREANDSLKTSPSSTFRSSTLGRSPSTGGSSTNLLDLIDETASSPWIDSASENLNDRGISHRQAHRLHVYATKHNTHIALVQPPRSAAQTMSSSVSRTSTSATEKKKVVDVLLSLSTGNIGFRKAGRGSYDAAYQLGAFAMKQMQEKGMVRDIRKLEVVLRGFGAGREAVTKILLGSEGRLVRNRISAVIDATRLKFGGNRSPKPRRLG